MELAHQAHEEAYTLVAGYLRQSFGDLAEADEERPYFSLALGRVGINVTVQAMGDDEAAINIYTWLAHGLEVTDEAARFLLERNGAFRVGRFSIDDDGDIMLDHTLLADTLSKAELATVVRWMSGIADEVEDELKMRFR